MKPPLATIIRYAVRHLGKTTAEVLDKVCSGIEMPVGYPVVGEVRYYVESAILYQESPVPPSIPVPNDFYNPQKP